MKQSRVEMNGAVFPVVAVDTVVLGSGAAGLNALDHLLHLGRSDVALVTENMLTGTSRNTGSDKQTYYKLSLSGKETDSVQALAEVLFAGGCVDGDHALCEAAHSVECFLKLAQLGVEFPKSRYGEYVGYKTDHDPARRATSAGPYTSKKMTERLEKSVRDQGAVLFDHYQAVRLLHNERQILGVLCLDLSAQVFEEAFAVFLCNHLVMATGGPAGMYRSSVYPKGQFGCSGLAFEAGACGKNLTEWQYGMASLRPRWNVSGSYMQCLPRFYSVDENGVEHEFLLSNLPNRAEMLEKVFLKGYQWPFEVTRIRNGSSMIDLLVYMECALKGRRVFLDFTKNPGDKPIDFAALPEEPRQYLENAGAVQQTPYLRLKQLNDPAIAFYRDHGVDLEREPLEIGLCVQHNNGGIDVDLWWESCVKGLYVVGEAAGTHGVHRPGGTALNAGQVGSLRAAAHISRLPEQEISVEARMRQCESQIAQMWELARTCKGSEDNAVELYNNVTETMSRVGSAVRSLQEIERAAADVRRLLDSLDTTACISNVFQLRVLFRLRDTLLSQYVYLSAMSDYVRQGGRSRGGALYTDESGELPDANFDERFRFCLEDGNQTAFAQIVALRGGECDCRWRENRPIPDEDLFFENVWRGYRENRNVY